MIAAWCFQCGLDYAEDVAECLECAVPTVDYPSSSLERLDPDEQQLAYELHAWNGEARVATELALHAARVRRGWQGPTLLVHETDEELVDEIIEEIDDTMVTDLTAAKEAEDGRIGFDLGARNESLHEQVKERLQAAKIEFELMSNGFLLVPTELEDEIGDMIESVQADLRSAETFGPGIPGVDSQSVVESLFLAADVLRRSPRDARRQRALLDNEATARELQLPFGYEAPMWRSVLDQAAVLAALIEDAAEDDFIEREAQTLREMLSTYV